MRERCVRPWAASGPTWRRRRFANGSRARSVGCALPGGANMAPNELFQRARRAYEIGRLRAALPAALWALPMLAASLFISGPGTAARVAAGVALALLLVF